MEVERPDDRDTKQQEAWSPISSPAINQVTGFCGHKYLKSRLVVAILNFSKITCTFSDGG